MLTFIIESKNKLSYGNLLDMGSILILKYNGKQYFLCWKKWVNNKWILTTPQIITIKDIINLIPSITMQIKDITYLFSYIFYSHKNSVIPIDLKQKYIDSLHDIFNEEYIINIEEM